MISRNNPLIIRRPFHPPVVALRTFEVPVVVRWKAMAAAIADMAVGIMTMIAAPVITVATATMTPVIIRRVHATGPLRLHLFELIGELLVMKKRFCPYVFNHSIVHLAGVPVKSVR